MKVGDKVKVSVTPYRVGVISEIFSNGLVLVDTGTGRLKPYHKTWLEVIHG